MTLLLSDDKGVLHPVVTNIDGRDKDNEALINRAKETSVFIQGHPPIMARAAKGSRKFIAL